MSLLLGLCVLLSVVMFFLFGFAVSAGVSAAWLVVLTGTLQASFAVVSQLAFFKRRLLSGSKIFESCLKLCC